MTTESTVAITKQLVAVALDTPNGSGVTARSLVGANVFVGTPPDGATYPNVVARLYGMQSDPNFDNTRVTATLELTVFARPRATAELAEQVADCLLVAFKQFRSATSGLAWCRGYQRDTLPAFREPADNDVVAIRVAAQLAFWPLLTTT